MVLLPSMFSSFLHPSSSAKMAQSGPSKPSNRFSVRVFKTQSNIPPSYPVTGKNDLNGYRPPPPPRESQREQQNMGWFPQSTGYTSYDARPRATANYAIYPSTTDGTFIYEQSSCSKSDIFSISEMDAASMATFSPAMSTDSTITLPSINAGDRLAEYAQPKRPETPAARPSYSGRGPSTSQVPAMSRATSNHRPAESTVDERVRTPTMQPRATTPNHFNAPSGRNESISQTLACNGYPIEIPEYAASSMSELEVQERDRIAKMNAEYNSASTGSLYSGNSGSSTESDGRRQPAISRNASVLNRESVAFNPSQQPLHPGLRFPPRVAEEPLLPHPSTQVNPGPSMAPNLAVFPPAFPIVERIPSQMPPPEHQAYPANFQATGYYPAVDPRGPPGPLRSSSYQTSPKKPLAQPPVPAPSHYSAQSTYGTSMPDTTVFSDHRPDRVPSTFIDTPRGRRTSFVGPRPEANLQRQPSEVRDPGSSSRAQADYRYDDGGRRSNDPVQPALRDATYSSRPDPPSRNQSASPRDLPRSGGTSDYRRDTRTPSPKEYDETRPTYVSRRDSYLDSSTRSGKDSRGRGHSNDVRDAYGAGHLSSSPIQMRESPTEIEATPSRHGGFSTSGPAYDQPKEYTRTRSTSFSAAVRPTLPSQSSGHQVPTSQQPQVYEMKRSDSRYASDEERYTRSGDWSASKGPSGDSARLASQYDYERRSDTRTSSSQATHYSQMAPVPTTSTGYEPSSQRQAASVSGPSMPSAPQTVDRTASVMQPQAGQARGGHAQENVSSRSRTPYPEPAYAQPQPPPQPLAEPVRRHSDPEKHYSSKENYAAKDSYSSSKDATYSTKDSRGSRPSESQSASVKPSGQQSTRAAHVLGAGTASSEPHRRNSDGDQNPPRPPLSGRMSAPLLRSVRWNDNLICPSPIPASARRKGWFNRRGDQLWTNDGAYKAAPIGQEYPPDLDDYPEYEEGWMNEEGVRIDLNHRLVPKPPLRSALKPARN